MIIGKCSTSDDGVLCPVCGGVNTHIQDVRIWNVNGINMVRVASTGIGISKQSKPTGRGAVISIEFWGECGHSWETTFSFHKGDTTVKTNAIQAQDEYLDKPDLWRD